jgi:crotonobetainyl-CoA:carnitine CoA-transferase CaiB-like acyl-CoA transferase
VFSVNDIRNVSAPREEYGDEGEYEEAEAGEALIPRFVTSTKTATRRARERKPRFLEVFPSECEHIYEEWVALLEGIDAPYLHLLTDELWAMDPEDFAVKLRAWLQAFEQNRADDWAALLQQVDIAFDPVTGRASLMEGETAREIGVALRGYRWLRPVPWSEE